MRISADMCRGVFDLRSMGELSLFDSVLESGRNISGKNKKKINENKKKCTNHAARLLSSINVW